MNGSRAFLTLDKQNTNKAKTQRQKKPPRNCVKRSAFRFDSNDKPTEQNKGIIKGVNSIRTRQKRITFTKRIDSKLTQANKHSNSRATH